MMRELEKIINEAVEETFAEVLGEKTDKQNSSGHYLITNKGKIEMLEYELKRVRRWVYVIGSILVLEVIALIALIAK